MLIFQLRWTSSPRFTVARSRGRHSAKRDAGIAEILNEGILFAKQASGHSWFDYNIDPRELAQKLKSRTAANHQQRNSSRSLKEIVAEKLNNLLFSPLVTLKNEDQSISIKNQNIPSAASNNDQKTSNSNSNDKRKFSLNPDNPLSQLFMKLQSTNVRFLSPRLMPLFQLQQNVTSVASPDLLSFFQQNSQVSLPAMLQTLGYNETEAAMWMSVIGEATGTNDILRCGGTEMCSYCTGYCRLHMKKSMI